MSRNNRILGFVVAAILVAGAALYALGPDEPSHAGRPLSEWLEQLAAPKDDDAKTSAEDALKAMGKTAVPRLIAKLRARDSDLKEQIELVARLQPWFNVSFSRASAERARAIKAFSVLGPAATDAVPELRRTLEEGENPKDVAETLAQIGPDAVVALGEALQSDDPNVRSAAIHGLDVSPFTPTDIADRFLILLADDNSIVRFHAARAIFHHPGSPERAVPALIARLDDDSNLVRRYAARALGAYGASAAEAAPKLREISTNRDEDARIIGAALSALERLENRL